MNYNHKYFFDVNKAFIAFSTSIIVSILIPIIWTIVYIIKGYNIFNNIDFSDHSTQAILVMHYIISSSVYLLGIEIYLIYSFCSFILAKKKLEGRTSVKHIILFVLLTIIILLIFGQIQWFLFFNAISEGWGFISLFTILILLPYFYLIVKKIQIKRGRKNYKKN